jgi:ATP-binding cassette subfamily C exporter for protease/lipase
MAGLDHVRTRIVIRAGARLDQQLSTRVFDAAFETNLRSGRLDAGQALGDLNTVRQFVTGNALFAFFDAPWFPVYLLVIFLFDPWLGLFALVGAVLLIMLAWLNERVSMKPLAEANQLALRANRLATAQLHNAEVIAAMGMLPALRRRWSVLQQEMLCQQQIASEKTGSISAGTRAARMTLQSLVLGFGAWLVLEDRITPGMMIAASILMGRALSPIELVIGVWKQWSGARLAWQRLDALLAAHPERDVTLILPRPEGRVAVEAVSAVPPGSRQVVLAGVSFTIGPGDVLGLVGPSASGKSTLARLLVGVWPAQTGTVRLDGADVYRWNKTELGPAIGYLPQDVALFPGSIGDNIARFGEPDAERVIEAARLAGVHEMILRFPQGYDTLMGEEGGGLSGGQKQRIALARALYGDPALVVLDEPNSNLDEAGEAALMHAITALRERGRTVVLVTHRSGVLAATTKLLLLKGGRVQAFGPTPQVLAALQRAAEEEPGRVTALKAGVA